MSSVTGLRSRLSCRICLSRAERVCSVSSLGPSPKTTPSRVHRAHSSPRQHNATSRGSLAARSSTSPVASGPTFQIWPSAWSAWRKSDSTSRRGTSQLSRFPRSDISIRRISASGFVTSKISTRTWGERASKRSRSNLLLPSRGKRRRPAMARFADGLRRESSRSRP